MAKSTRTRQKKTTGLLKLDVLALAAWQLRQTWSLLLFIIPGMIAAVIIACSIPLYSEIMLTAGLRGALRATPDSSTIQLNTQTAGLSSSTVKDVYAQFEPLFRQYLGNTIQPEQFSITSDDFSFYPPRQKTTLIVYGAAMQQAAPYFGPLQGRIVRATSNPLNDMEVMMTPDTARQLGVSVGSTLRMTMNYTVNLPTLSGGLPLTQQHSRTISAHVVGLFSVTPANTVFWQGQDFKPLTFAEEASAPLHQYTVLVSADALLAMFDRLAASYHTNAILSGIYNTDTGDVSGYSLAWHYRLDASRYTINDLDSLVSHLTGLQSMIDTLYGDMEGAGPPDVPVSYPYLYHVELSGQILNSNANGSILTGFQSRVAVAQIPTGIFVILSLALVLFFVSLMTTLLVDRQADTIAILRSRGASGGQIFAALFLQSAALGIIALIIGPLLAMYLVFLLAQRLLPATELDALNLITNHPLQAALGTFWYGLVIVLVALLTMGLSLYAAARLNVVSLRRESARSRVRPLWQRLNLDVIAGVIAIVGYAFSLYLTSIGNVLQGNAKTLVATPLSIIAPFFLILGCLLLLLRLFPWLLQFGMRLVARGRGVAAMLALAQVARSPRQSLRMLLLLTLAITFTLFSLVYYATESNHIQQIVTYQAGADFSGDSYFPKTMPAQVIGQYQSIPGVLSASAGYVDQGIGGTADLPMSFQAVDAGSYGDTVIWPSQTASRAALPLLARLVSLRPLSTSSGLVPAIVDQTTISKLLLHVGSSFTITLDNTSPPIHCIIIGVVDRIPTINNLTMPSSGNTPVITGGVLVDFQTFASAHALDAKTSKVNSSATIPPINYVWLRTRSDPASLASVRSVLKNPRFSFTSLVDRRLLLATLQSDPLYLVLDGVLGIGTVTALLLALVGSLLTSWLSTRTRLVNFAALRAMGTTSRQVTGIFTWEQAIVYIAGLLLGGGFGALLVASVLPALTYTDLNLNLSNQQTFALQSELASQVVVPPALALLLLVLVVIFTLALALMARTVAQPASSQVLRLNED